MQLFLILLFGAFLLVASIIVGIGLEKEVYNNGNCRNCGKRLIYFGNDNHGNRGYKCPECGYTAWVSYRNIDKNKKLKK